MDIENDPEAYHRTQTRLLEIYKIQLRDINDISNRRININRYYLLIMSGLMIAVTAFLRIGLLPQNSPVEIPRIENQDLLVVNISSMIVGFIGFILCWTWLYTTDSYLRRNSRKYEVLKHLESNLEYQFLGTEWSTLGLKNIDRNYRSLANVEFLLPSAFFLSFFGLYCLGIIQMSISTIFIILFVAIPVILISVFIHHCSSHHKNEKNETIKIRKTYRAE